VEGAVQEGISSEVGVEEGVQEGRSADSGEGNTVSAEEEGEAAKVDEGVQEVATETEGVYSFDVVFCPSCVVYGLLVQLSVTDVHDE
jgi:hypothetical protein